MENDAQSHENEEQAAVERRRAAAQNSSAGPSLEERVASAPDERMQFPRAGKKRSDGRPRGARRSQANLRVDLEQVAKYLTDNKPRWWIIEHYQKRNVPSATVDRWIASVRERMTDSFADEITTLREKLLIQMRRQRKACIEGGDQTNARHYFKLEMDLVGMRAPEDHKHVHLHAAQTVEPIKSADELLQALEPSDEQLGVLATLAAKAAHKRTQEFSALSQKATATEDISDG